MTTQPEHDIGQSELTFTAKGITVLIFTILTFFYSVPGTPLFAAVSKQISLL